jgi:hypothetical protein
VKGDGERAHHQILNFTGRVQARAIPAQHPDQFILYLFDLAPDLVAAAARDHRESLRNPPKTVGQHLGALEAQGLTQTVSVLRKYMS